MRSAWSQGKRFCHAPGDENPILLWGPGAWQPVSQPIPTTEDNLVKSSICIAEKEMPVDHYRRCSPSIAASYRRSSHRILAAAALLGAGISWVGVAGAFVIESTLTGDPRPENPDGIVVNVTIEVGTESGQTDDSTAKWTIDIESDPPHSNIRMDSFYFNLAAPYSDFDFFDYDPTDWIVDQVGSASSGSGTNSIQGGGSQFVFESSDTSLSNSPNSEPNVDNDTNLTFFMTYLDGAIGSELFFDALPGEIEDTFTGQLGAHLLSLSTDTCSDCASGFALGSYGVGGGPSGPSGDPIVPQVPEPQTLWLIGLGLAAFTRIGWRSKGAR
jgi:hypothetical protein